MSKRAILKTLASILAISAASTAVVMVGVIKGWSSHSASARGVCLAACLYVFLRELKFRRWWQE